MSKPEGSDRVRRFSYYDKLSSKSAQPLQNGHRSELVKNINEKSSIDETQTNSTEATKDEKEEKDKSLPESEATIAKIEDALINLDASFSEVAAVQDPVNQEYKLLKEAKRLDMPVESYRRLFENYYLQRLPKKIKYSWLRPVQFLDQRLGDLVKWCETVSLYSLATVLGELTLLVAMGSYLIDTPKRQQQELDAARQEIRSQKEMENSQTRIDALDTLNKACESMLGEQMPKANLEGIKMNQCYKFQLEKATFAQWPPKFYRYEGFDLSKANLAGANLKGADLKEANLEGADLGGANLEGANLEGANLKKANLKGAILRVANLEKANLEEANLDNARLSRANLRGANLKKATIMNAWLLWADLTGAQLTEANLQDSNLSRTNLQEAELYKTNLKGALLRYADLRNGTIIIGADVEHANFRRAKFASVDQVKRAYNWEKATKDNDWEAKIAKPGSETYNVGFLVPHNASIYKLYQEGIEKAARENEKIKIFPIETGVTVEEEAEGIKQLLAQDIDVILMKPQDQEKSLAAINEAYAAGTVVINIGDCLPKESQKVVFACYESDSLKVGYDLGKYTGTWAKTNLQGQDVNVGTVDGADSSSVYPYYQGFMAGMKDSGVNWKLTASTNAQTADDGQKVKEMLQEHKNINILWGGTQTTTELALQTVKEMGLAKKVNVFGIVPLSDKLSKRLLDPNDPLQSIVDESPSEVGYEATNDAIAVIEGTTTRGYKDNVFPYRLLTQNSAETINKLIGNVREYEKHPLKPAEPLKHNPLVIASTIPSTLSAATATMLPAVTDKAQIKKLQEQFQKQILKNWQTVPKFDKDLVYRVLLKNDGSIASYEPINPLAIDLLQSTPLPKLSKTDVINDPLKATNKPVVEFKVVFEPNGKVEVTWGDNFVQVE